MGRPKQFTDLQLRTLIRQGYTQGEIAEELGVSPSAVSQRVRLLKPAVRAGLEPDEVAGAPVTAEQHQALLWNNYRRVGEMLDDKSASTRHKLRIIGEMRRQLGG
jgi:DNA-binding Lrp family transcriptional regulator